MWALSQQLKQRSSMHQLWLKCNVVVYRKKMKVFCMLKCVNVEILTVNIIL